jgi:hypothetical protein
MEIPRFICMTSDKYIQAVKPYLWLMRKYWKEETVDVLVAGFSKPDFKMGLGRPEGNVKAKFHSIGDFDKYPLDKWSNSLIDLLKQIDDELVVIMLEDYWVIREINVPAVVHATSYMKKYPRTIKFDLAADRLFAGGAIKNFRHHRWLDIVKSNPESHYHMSLMTGMWRRELLLKVLRPNWSPWDVELAGTTVLAKDFPEYEVVGSAQWPVKHTLAFRSGDQTKLLLEEVQQEDKYTLSQLGFLKPWDM